MPLIWLLEDHPAPQVHGESKAWFNSWTLLLAPDCGWCLQGIQSSCSERSWDVSAWKAAEGQRPIVSLSQWHFFLPGILLHRDLKVIFLLARERSYHCSGILTQRDWSHDVGTEEEGDTLPLGLFPVQNITRKGLINPFWGGLSSNAGVSFPPIEFPMGSSSALMLLPWFPPPWPAPLPAGERIPVSESVRQWDRRDQMETEMGFAHRILSTLNNTEQSSVLLHHAYLRAAHPCGSNPAFVKLHCSMLACDTEACV